MAGNKNDKRILDLKKQIEDKKKELSTGTKFSPTTNCSLQLYGIDRVNIHTMSTNTILLAIGIIKSRADGLKAIFPDKELIIDGFSADDWIGDLKQKYITLNVIEERQKLSKLEEKLKVLLSSEKQVELALDDIENLIK